MGCRSKTVWLVFGTALFAGQAAQAADSVYLGDCDRARTVQNESTVDKLIPHTRYEGTQRAQFPFTAADVCVANSLIVYTLTERERNEDTVVFNMVRTDVFYTKKTGCAPVTLGQQTYTGTVAFTTSLQLQGELCEIYIKATWLHEGANKLTDFWNRVISMENGAFVISQPVSAAGIFRTPLAFTGVNQ